MHLLRYRNQVTGIVGLAVQDSTIRPLHFNGQAMAGFAELLRLPLAEIRDLVRGSELQSADVGAIELLSPCDGRMEVWAAGVTYLRSRDARMEESTERTVYDRVYVADRPELFFKSVPWRVVTGGAPITVRSDSMLNVPEPELAALINVHREIIGYTVCNDVSSRSIEGENPLYLPQAKVYDASCAIAARVRPTWEIPDPYALGIHAKITRGPDTVWESKTNTALLNRRISDLADWLFAEQDFPEGVILSTGTGLVPPMSVSLLPGDEVIITIDNVGDLTNSVSISMTGRATHEPERKISNEHY